MQPRVILGLLAALLFLLIGPALAPGAPIALPPRPTRYVTDAAGVLSPPVRDKVNATLEKFERDTSTQFVVALYPSLPPGQDLSDYCIRTFTQWKIGQSGKDNGVALFVFVESRKMQIVTGYGLEGALPDATCKAIIDEQIAPQFRKGDYDAGITAGVNAVIAATRGEYHGTETTAFSRHAENIERLVVFGVVALFIILGVLQALLRSAYGTLYTSRPPGFFSGLLYGWAMNSSILGGWGGGSSGGGTWGGGGGGFLGGGGMTGGGGAGGSW